MKETMFKMLSGKSNKLLALYVKLVHVVSSTCCCVKYYRVSTVSQLCAALYVFREFMSV